MDESIITLPDDGLYNINHIVLPTVEWLQSMDDPEYLSEYIGGIYVTDGENIYLSENNSLTIIEPKDFIQLDTYKTTISKNSKPTFSIYNLQKCYIRLCNSILQNDYIKCRKDVDSELNFKRDLAWMTINVIKYYIGFGQLYEAQRVLERVNYCKGICQDSIISATYIHNNCGCSG